MKVVVHPADQGGCGHYRLIFPANVLKSQGLDVTVETDREYRAVWQPSPFGDKVIGLDEHLDVDVVVIQRPLHRNRVELIDVLQQQGIAVVVEVDDDFHSLHKRNPAWHQTNPLHDRDKNWDWLMRACDRADLVTVSTPALADRYGAHGRVQVLPNYVPDWYLHVRPDPHDGVVVGWSGSTHTHPGDLEVTSGGVARACTDTNARLKVVGSGAGVARALRLDQEPVATGWLPIAQYPHALADLDVGVVPLRASQFNEAKSNLKMSEMAALGVPAVGSPTSENQALVELGAGLIADTPAAWYETICRLACSPALREAVAGRARAAMAERTYEMQAWRWWEAWTVAAARRQGQAAA